MSAKRESNGKNNTVRSKKRRSSSRKKKPKVLLNSKYVCILCASIVIFCALLLGTTFLLNSSPDNSSSVKKDGARTENVSSLPSADKKAGDKKALDKKVAGKKDPKKNDDALKPDSGKSEHFVASEGNAVGENKVKAGHVNEESFNASEGNANHGNDGQDNNHSVKPAPETASISKPNRPDAAIQEAKPKFNVPPAQKGARLAFVIDDGGMNTANVKKYTSLPFPVTVAVLPGLPHTRECADLVRRDGKELMLHQPMQAKNLNLNPGPGAITPEMDSYGIMQVIEKNLGELGPGVKGFNNHEGSLITEDKLKMTFVIDLAMQKGLYFLDSRTTSQTQARQAALELDAHIIERNAPFLDNAVTREDMLREIYKGLEVANKAGYAVIIGHVDKSAAVLPKLLEDLYPELKSKGYVFTTPSRL